MRENIKTVLSDELKSLEIDLKKDQLITNNKKAIFIEDLKENVGGIMIENINNPNRHNPKKMSFWSKLMKAIGC